jgi:hypothetical protein
MGDNKSNSSKADKPEIQKKPQGPDPKLESHIELGEPRQGPDPKLASYVEKGFGLKK